jgi:hypothetical protein
MTTRTEGAVKAEARQRAFSVLRKAWKRRSAEGFTANELAVALGRDKAQVSRVLNGHSPTMTLETLALFLDRLNFKYEQDCTAYEEVPLLNHNARPLLPTNPHSNSKSSSIGIEERVKASSNVVFQAFF